eukprot:scaffold20263_cov69-Cyclotella_meneghiniana.AAC.15
MHIHNCVGWTYLLLLLSLELLYHTGRTRDKANLGLQHYWLHHIQYIFYFRGCAVAVYSHPALLPFPSTSHVDTKTFLLSPTSYHFYVYADSPAGVIAASISIIFALPSPTRPNSNISDFTISASSVTHMVQPQPQPPIIPQPVIVL